MFEIITSVILAVAAIASPEHSAAKLYDYHAYIAQEKYYLEPQGIMDIPDGYVLDISDTLLDSVMDTKGHIMDKNEIKSLIIKEFPDDLIMVRVAQCESGLVHYEENGGVLTGKEVPTDTGLFQISAQHWAEKSKKLGVDFYTLEGNIQMAKYLLKNGGLNHWGASASCWLRSF